jgi:outer membrane protein, multidrug efflux system
MNAPVSPPRSGRIFFARALALAALALSGCAVGPDYHPPATTTSANWVDSGQSNSTAVTSHLVPSPVTTVDWWTVFGDAQLNDLVQKAASQNLTVLQAETRVRQARASKGVAIGGVLPSVNASGSYNYSSGPHYIGDEPVETNPSTFWQSGLDAAWELDIFGGKRRAIEAAEAGVQVAIQDRRDTLVTLVAEVGADYIDLRNQQELLRIANTTLEAEQHTADITDQRFQAGFVSELDYANAKAAADSTRSQIPSIQSAIQSDIFSLSVLLGLQPAALLTQLSTPGPLPKTPDTVPIGLPADLIRRRPDVRAAEELVHADNANIGVALSQWYPQFTLNGSFGFQGVSIGQMTQWASQTWAWGPSINWPIFAGGEIVSQVELQKATLQGDLYAYQNTVLTALQEVETEIVAFNKEQERRAALRDAVADNQKAMDLSLQLYEQGETEFINVLTAELSLSSAQDQLAASDAAVATDLVALFKALGGGWSEFPEQGAAVVEPDKTPKTAP